MRILFLCLALAAPLAAASPYEINLKGAEDAALSSSSTLKSAGFEQQAAQDRDDAALTALYPRISLDASDEYLSHVAALPLGGKEFPFGDYNNYSYGIDANWTIWDSGKSYNLYKSLEAGQDAKQAQFEAQKRQVRLQARLAYFQTQLMAERARLMADSLKLSQSEATDIDLRLKAGASSRIDSLSANNEVLQARSDYRQARADLASALRDLFAQTGLGGDLDPSVPQEASAQDNAPADTEPATLSLKLESLESALAELEPAESATFNADQPQLQAIKAATDEAQRQASALQAGHWPTVEVGFRSSLSYPDGPILSRAQQNATSIAATWPLFAFGQVSKQVKEQEDLASASQAKGTALATDLQRDWLKSHDRLKALRDQKALDEQSVTATDNLYKLIYNSYQNGSSSLLEVQTASLHALEAKVGLASTETQMLIELALQSSLSE